MNDVLQDIFETGKIVNDAGVETQVFPTGITQADGLALYNCILANKATRTIETGFAYGISTLFICQALRELGGGSHTAIDPFQDGYGDLGLLNVKRAGFDDLFTFRREYSQDILCEYLKRGDRFDFAFLDGHHTFEQIILEFYYFEKLMDVGSHIVIHDLCMPSVQKATTFILRNYAWELDMAAHTKPLSLAGRVVAYGRHISQSWREPYTWFLAPHVFQSNFIILRKAANDSRPFDHYAPF